MNTDEIMESIKKHRESPCARELKYHFGDVLTEETKAKTVIAFMEATNLDANDERAPKAFLVATMYYAIDKGEAVERIKLQKLLRMIYQKEDSSESIKNSIKELLTIKSAGSKRFCNVLKRIILSAKLNRASIDYESLLKDLIYWERYDRYRDWANTILLTKKEEEKEND